MTMVRRKESGSVGLREIDTHHLGSVIVSKVSAFLPLDFGNLSPG